jgi:hypothetical protein
VTTDLVRAGMRCPAAIPKLDPSTTVPTLMAVPRPGKSGLTHATLGAAQVDIVHPFTNWSA